jgi:iron complex outermembrane receptor protein
MMKTLARLSALCVFALVLLLGPAALAAATATGAIRGRILNPETGEYLYQARVRVKSTPGAANAAIETFTDGQGNYLLNRVPAGPVVLEVFYTGMAPKTGAVSVPATGEARLDFELARPAAKAEGEVLKLETFVVTAAREMSATALAVNSQRFSENTKSVIAVDELGFVGDGSVAGAMKFLPGIDLEPDSSGFSNGITLSGAPSANLPVTYGGFDVMTSADLIQNASGNQNQRTANLMQLSLTNISRIEINRSPTPDSPGSALAGSVNFVPKSAFERVRPN